MWQAVEFRFFQKSAVKSQSAPTVVFRFRFSKLAFIACSWIMKSWSCLLVLFACYGLWLAANSLHSRVYGVKLYTNVLYVHFGSAGHIFGPWIHANVYLWLDFNFARHCWWWSFVRSKHFTKSSLLEPLSHESISSSPSTAPFKRSRVGVPL